LIYLWFEDDTKKANVTAQLRFEDVSLCYNGHWVLRDVNMVVRSGEFVSLIGPSGCGKTSLLRMVAQLVEPTSGRVTIELANVSGVSAGGGRARQAYVFQEPNLLPWRTVVENIALPLELSGQKRRVAIQTAREVIARVGLELRDAYKFPDMLSGGMRMRVSLARALVTRPDLMLLDEPFAALDDILRQRMNEELLAIWNQDRWTALFVTHNVAEAVFLSQRVLVLGGKPARITKEFVIPFEQPRLWSLRGTAEFAAMCHEIAAQVREDGP